MDIFVEPVSQGAYLELRSICQNMEPNTPVSVATVIEHPDRSRVGRRILVRPSTAQVAGYGSKAGVGSGGRIDDAVTATRVVASRSETPWC